MALTDWQNGTRPKSLSNSSGPSLGLWLRSRRDSGCAAPGQRAFTFAAAL